VPGIFLSTAISENRLVLPQFLTPVTLSTPVVRFSERKGHHRNQLIFCIFFAIGLDGQSLNDMEKEREKGRFWGRNVRFGGESQSDWKEARSAAWRVENPFISRAYTPQTAVAPR
jgi:hypothetical protein